jgi:hypothetical protein
MKTLGVFLNGVAEFETLFHILTRLHQRGRIRLKIYMPGGLPRRVPRVTRAIAEAGLPVDIRPNFALKRAHGRWFRGMDAVLDLSDPDYDATAYAARTNALRDLGVPLIFVQHGGNQGFLTCLMTRVFDYYAGLMLLFNPVPERFRENFPQSAWEAMRTVGFLKKNVYDAPAPPPELQAKLSAAKQVVLICHSFRWQGRFADHLVDEFYAMVAEFCAAHPDRLVIVRSHRGKIRDVNRDNDRRLVGIANLVFSYSHSGPMKGWPINQVLAISDICVTHSSTVVLDAVYADTPVALLPEDDPERYFYTGVPVIGDIGALEQFCADPGASAPAQAAIRAEYGDLDSNINRACNEIEAFMAALPAKPQP